MLVVGILEAPFFRVSFSFVYRLGLARKGLRRRTQVSIGAASGTRGDSTRGLQFRHIHGAAAATRSHSALHRPRANFGWRDMHCTHTQHGFRPVQCIPARLPGRRVGIYGEFLTEEVCGVQSPCKNICAAPRSTIFRPRQAYLHQFRKSACIQLQLGTHVVQIPEMHVR